MQAFIDTLFLYAKEKQTFRYLQTPEYRRAVYELEESWERFRSVLTKEQDQVLDAILCKELKVQHLEDEASFAAGISIGLELGRL